MLPLNGKPSQGKSDPGNTYLLRAVLKTEVTPETTSVVKPEYVLPKLTVPPDEDEPNPVETVLDKVSCRIHLDIGRAYVVATTPLVVVVVTVPEALIDVSVLVMVLPAELVVVMTTTPAPDAALVGGPRRALMSDSSAAI